MILNFTIGRARECEQLLRNTTQGNHTLVIGRNGVGKTHLLVDLKRQLRETDTAIHYVPRPVPAKETIESIYAWLAMLAGVGLPRKIGRDTRIADFCGFIAELLSHPHLAGKKLVLLVDDFDHLPVLSVPIFEILAERVTLVTASRSRKHSPRFNRLLWRFEELQVNPLAAHDARELAARAIAGVPGIKLPDDRTREFLVTRIATLSNGMPSAIIESVDRLRGAERIDASFIREIFVHRSADTFFDATPLILTFFAFLIVMRYINRGMYQFDMYAIFGALSGLMLLMRWFMMRTSRENA